jgi:hypothetical protein
MRNDQTTRPMSKSPLRIARTARRIAERAPPRYSSKYSPQRFTQAQLVACLVLRQFFRTDYRGLVALLEDFPELRRALKLKCLPHYSTLGYAQHRLMRSARIRALQRELLRAVPASLSVRPPSPMPQDSRHAMSAGITLSARVSARAAVASPSSACWQKPRAISWRAPT